MEIACALKTTPGALFESISQDKPKSKKTFKDILMTDFLGFPDPNDEENEDLYFDPYELYDSQELRYRFSNNLRFLMQNEHINNATLANKICVSESAVGKWLSGNVLPRSNMQLKIADFFAIKRSELFANPTDKIKNENSYRKTQVLPESLPKKSYSYPLVGTVAAGSPILAEEHIENRIELNIEIKADFALKIKGDSMIDANIYDGDIVFIRQQAVVENGEIAAVMIIDPDTSDARATLKRVYKTSDGLTLLSENRAKAYPPIFVNSHTCDNAKILGKAVKCITDIR